MTPFSQTGTGRKATGRQKRGFTLIEILVVIAIVTLLAGILFSAFFAVRESGRTSSCASNLKQIGLAIAMYANDNRGHYPNNRTAIGVVRTGGRFDTGSCAWADIILPYTRTTAVFICPSTRNLPYVPGCGPDAIDADPENPDPNNENDYGFGINYDGGYDMNTFSPNEFVGESRLNHPDTTISVLDGIGQMVSPAFKSPMESTTSMSEHPRHKDGNNVLFVDGHVKWMTVDSLRDLSLWRIGNPTR